MVFYSPDWTNIWFSFILLTVNRFRHHTLIEHRFKFVNFNSISLANLDVCQTSETVRDIEYALAKVDNLCSNVDA